MKHDPKRSVPSSLQQRKRNVPAYPCLDLHLHLEVQVQPELQARVARALPTSTRIITPRSTRTLPALPTRRTLPPKSTRTRTTALAETRARITSAGAKTRTPPLAPTVSLAGRRRVPEQHQWLHRGHAETPVLLWRLLLLPFLLPFLFPSPLVERRRRWLLVCGRRRLRLVIERHGRWHLRLVLGWQWRTRLRMPLRLRMPPTPLCAPGGGAFWLWWWWGLVCWLFKSGSGRRGGGRRESGGGRARGRARGTGRPGRGAGGGTGVVSHWFLGEITGGVQGRKEKEMGAERGLPL
ncbi:hypothetical protein C8R43DRAFT_1041057 [Mycena crocata]|nr:hypothetical protein C8R43DRAFT_1041057 [Mycena crocata]